MEALRDHLGLMDNLSIHYYFSGRRNPFGGDVKFTDDEYINLLFDVQNLEYQIQQAISIVDFFSERTKNIGIIVDEWGTWHPQATVESGLCQQNTLRDAILAAVVLNLFNKYSSRIIMTNIAQTVNVLQSLCLTRGDKTILTPTYHVFNLYKYHMGNHALMVDVQSPIVSETSKLPSVRRLVPPKALDASASLSGDGRRLVMTLVNQSLDEDLCTEIHLVGNKDVEVGELSVLGAKDIRAYNDFDSTDRVIPTDETVKMKERIFDYVALRHSVSRIILAMK
jgi:alpha-N-arabinofuranosidase